MTDNQLINGNPLCPHEAWVKIDSGTRRKCFHCGFVPPDNKPAVSDSPNDCTNHTVLMLAGIIGMLAEIASLLQSANEYSGEKK